MVGSKAMMKKEFTDWLAQAAVQVATAQAVPASAPGAAARL